MRDSATTARAEKRLLGTFFVLLSAWLMVAIAGVSRASGQDQTPKPSAGEPSPSDKAPGKEKPAESLPPGALRRLGQHGEEGKRIGHNGAINSLVFSADGRLLASWGADEEGPQLRVWEVATGKALHKLDGRGNLAFTLDGKGLLSRSSVDDNVDDVLLWDLATEKVRVRIPLKQLKFVQMLEGGKQCLIVYGLDQAAYVDVVTGKITDAITARWGQPLGLSHDGTRLAAIRRGEGGDSKSGDTRIYLVDLTKRGEEVGLLLGKQGRLLAADFSPEPLAPQDPKRAERLFAAGGYDNAIHVWDARPQQQGPWALLAGHTARVVRLAFSPDGRFLVSTSMDGTIRVWDLAIPRPEGGAVATLSESLLFRGHLDYATPVAFSPDGRLLATGGSSSDRTIVLWDFWKLVLGQGDPLTAPSDAKLQALWNDLASDAPGPRALAAVGTLATAPAEAIRFVQRQIDPYVQEAQRDRILELIAQLDDGKYAVREAATEALIRLRRQAEGILRTALRQTPSIEVRFRLRRILSQGNAAPSISPAEVRRYRRAVLLLERLGSADARKLLEHLSEVLPSPEVNRDAREALARLRKSGT